MRHPLLLLALLAGCAPRITELPPEALATPRPPPTVGLVLDTHPPLPGEPLDGWEPLAGPTPDAQDALTADEAVRIALANNRDLAAARREVEVARGALIAARALPNPHLELGLGDAKAAAIGSVGVELELTELLMTPARASAASPALDAARYRVQIAEVRLAYDVRAAFLEHQAAIARWEAAIRAVDAAAAGRELAEALYAAGNVPELHVATQQADYESARMRAAELELAVHATREGVQRLLGTETPWTAVRLPALVPAPIPEDLEERAVAASLELQETRSRLQAQNRTLGLERAEAWIPGVGLAVEAEGEDGAWGSAVGLSASIPLFDLGRGEILAARAARDATADSWAAQAVQVRSAAREARIRLASAEQRALHLQEVIVPARERVLRETLLQYNAMQLGTYELLTALRLRLEAELALADTRREAWTARAAVDALLAGARVDAPNTAVTATANTNEAGGH